MYSIYKEITIFNVILHRLQTLFLPREAVQAIGLVLVALALVHGTLT